MKFETCLVLLDLVQTLIASCPGSGKNLLSALPEVTTCPLPFSPLRCCHQAPYDTSDPVTLLSDTLMTSHCL